MPSFDNKKDNTVIINGIKYYQAFLVMDFSKSNPIEVHIDKNDNKFVNKNLVPEVQEIKGK